MKIGILISLVLVLMFVGLFVVQWRGQPTSPTSATAMDKLARFDLPADLPPIHQPRAPDEDATGDYQKAYDAFWQVRGDLATNPDAILQMADAVVRAADGGHVEEDFADAWIGFDYESAGAAASPVFEIGQAMLQHAFHVAGRGGLSDEKAHQINRAVFVFGQRAFTRNSRLATRYAGLAVMEAAGQVLFGATETPDLDDPMWAWGDAIVEVRQHWQPKVQIVRSPKPHAGDLIRIAEHDGDRTFRIAATYWLGVARFTSAGSRGNRRVINHAIETAQASSDPVIREAGNAAAALTLEQFRKMR